MSNAVRQITTSAELRSWVRQLESQRVTSFTFLPGGALARRCPGGDVGGLVMDLMPLVRSIRTTVSTQNDVVTQVKCDVGYHACVTMLDAWRTRRVSSLTETEQQALRKADEIVRTITGRRGKPMEQLHLLYSYIGSAIEYTPGDEHTQEFKLLTNAAATLLRKIGNCQGFAGVMYLLGGMMGFRVSLQGGRSTAGGHMWNVIDVGQQRYAMDCSAAAVARSEKRQMISDYASFLMGKQEAAENGLTWTAEMETAPIADSLAPAHDFYHACRTDFTDVDTAARELWRRRIAGDAKTRLRIRARSKVTLDELVKAMKTVADEPEMNREIFSKIQGDVSYGLRGGNAGKVLYATVEWK